MDEALVAIAGVPESELAAEVAHTLPASASAPPWRCQVEAVLWFHTSRPGSADALPAALERRPRLPVVVAGILHYTDSPVGSYSEVLGVPALVLGPLPEAHVAFIAVDSTESLVGGRANWALPKVLADFDGALFRGGAVTATGSNWMVRARTRCRSPRLPTWMRYSCCQVAGDGHLRHFPVTARGWSRPGAVEVEVSSSGPLATWLVPGRHAGFSFTGRVSVGATSSS